MENKKAGRPRRKTPRAYYQLKLEPELMTKLKAAHAAVSAVRRKRISLNAYIEEIITKEMHALEWRPPKMENSEWIRQQFEAEEQKQRQAAERKGKPQD